jgi:hypothetical protein
VENDTECVVSKHHPHTAMVAFSGSARNMQVQSSMMCVETGLLMVESEPLLSVPSSDKAANALLPGGQKSEAHPVQFKWSVSNDRPHLIMKDIVMTTRTSKQPSTPLSSRTSGNMAGPSEAQTKDTAPYEAAVAPNDCQHNETSWSDDAPDILEIRIRVGGEMGTAFLVFSGYSEENRESLLLELPIRRPTVLNSEQSASSESVFTDQARLRLLVRFVDRHIERVDASADEVPLSVATSTSSSVTLSIPTPHDHLQSSYPMVTPTKSVLEAQIGPLLRKIHRQEQEAWKLHWARKAILDGGVGVNNDMPNPHRPFAARAFCAWEHIRDLVTACHNGSAYSGAAAKYADDACDSSTIGTHDSWEL